MRRAAGLVLGTCRLALVSLPLSEPAPSWGLEVTAEMSVHWILVGRGGHQVHHHGVLLLSFLMYTLSPSLAGGPSLLGALLAESSAHPRGLLSAITAPVHCGSSFLPPGGLRSIFPLRQVMFLIRAPELIRNMAQDSDCNCWGAWGTLCEVTLFLPVAPHSPRAVLTFSCVPLA